MAAKSATSLTKSDAHAKAFVTFRVTGDALVPADVTKLLKIQATEIRYKGIPCSTGRSGKIMPSTNVWFFSTDKVVASNDLYDHVALVLYLIGLERPNRTEPSDKSISEKLTRLLSLKDFLQKQSAKAVMSFFWHGGPNSNPPRITDELFDLLKLLDIEIDMDFDKDEDPGKSGRKTRAA